MCIQKYIFFERSRTYSNVFERLRTHSNVVDLFERMLIQKYIFCFELEREGKNNRIGKPFEHAKKCFRICESILSKKHFSNLKKENFQQKDVFEHN